MALPLFLRKTSKERGALRALQPEMMHWPLRPGVRRSMPAILAKDFTDSPASAEHAQIHILILSTAFPPVVGGAGVVPEALASCLPRNISVLTQTAGSPPLSKSDWAAFDRRFPFPVYRLRSLYTSIPFRLHPKLRGALQFAYNYLWIRPILLIKIFRILRQRPSQVICVNTIGIGYWMPRLFKLLKPRVKVIFYVHGEELSDGRAPTRYYRALQTSLVHADALVTVSSYTARLAREQGASPDRICVIRNGVDTVKYSPGPKDAALQARFGLQGKRVLLCLARLDERKGQDMLIQAMPHILHAVPDAVLLLVGSGQWESRLRDLVEELGLQQSVILAGAASDDEVVRYYRTADVYVMPNRTTETGDTEGFGLVFLEAGACAKPVVGGIAGGVPDAILHGQTGLLVDGRSLPSIAAGCVRLLTDPELAARMGRAGLDHARRNTWTGQAARFLRLCEAVVRDQSLTEDTPGY
jgi:phosphatidylinositol alpha-1,6-mannosyltransferase